MYVSVRVCSLQKIESKLSCILNIGLDSKLLPFFDKLCKVTFLNLKGYHLNFKQHFYIFCSFSFLIFINFPHQCRLLCFIMLSKCNNCKVLSLPNITRFV